MEKLEQENFDINTFSDIEDIYKPTDATIQKELVNSITNLSNLLSNGIVFINYGIYENIKQTKGSNYAIPKDCKILSDVINKNSKRDTLRQLKKQYSDSNKSVNNDSIDIIVTNADKEEAIEEYFGMDQSMIKPHPDFNFGIESSMLFDQSAIFSNIDMVGDNIANQSMIFMDSNGRNIFSHDDPENHGSMFLNINGLTDLHTGTEAEGNNSTLVNLADVDNNYLSTSDNESNNSTACWDDMAPVSRTNEENCTDEDDQPLKDEFNQAFAKQKFTGLDVHNLKYGNVKSSIMRNPSSSVIQVHQYQVVPDAWNDENDEINLAKATLKKQGYKNGFPHQKLYPVVETPYLNESNSSFVNNYNDTINSSFIKDDLSITKDIVNKNVKKFNSMGLETEEYIQKSNPSSSFVFSNSFMPESTETNTSSIELNPHASSTIIRNAPSPLPTVSYSSSPDNKESILSVNNFASLKSKFNQTNNQSDEYPINKSNHIWSYKMKQESQDIPVSDSERYQLDGPTSAVDDVNANGSIIIPEKLNIKDRINDIEASIIVNNASNEQSLQEDNASLEEQPQQNETIDASVADTTIIKSNVIDDILDVSVGTVKDLVTGLEQNGTAVENDDIEDLSHVLSMDNTKEELVTEDEKLPNTEEDKFEVNDVEDEEQPLEFLSDQEEQEQPIEFVSDIENVEEEQMVENDVPETINDENNEEIAEEPIEFLPDNEIEPVVSVHENEEEIEEPIEFIIDNEDHVEEDLHQDNNEDEEPIEFLDDENAVEEPIEYMDNNENNVEQSILFDKGTENLINNELIEGNLEDHIIIEEEDSIVCNAIEEALENKSFVIQENPFIDEPYANDLSFNFDGHAAFHEAMKIFEDKPLETIKEEEEEEENILSENNLINGTQEQWGQTNIEDIKEENDNRDSEAKILEMIENNINEPDDAKMNDMVIHSFIHENQDIVNSMLPLADEELLPINSEFVNESEPITGEAKQEVILECNNEQDVQKDEIDVPEIEVEEEKQSESTKNPKKESKINNKEKSDKVVQKKKKVHAKKPVMKKEIKSSMEKSKKITSEPVNKPKTKTIKKSSKSLVLPTRNLIPTVNKVDPFIANNNCVKAFTSTSLKQNIISTRPVEHEVTVSFSDFDKSTRSKPLSKSKSIPKIMPKTISKPITKPTPKKSTLVYGSNVKPLTKTSTQKSISKSTKKSIISKPRRKINSKIDKENSSIIINKRSLKKDIPPFKIIPELKNNKEINNKNIKNKTQTSNSKSSSFIVASKPKILEPKKTNAIKKERTVRSRQSSLSSNDYHITYYPKNKRKNIIQYTSDIRSKENIYYKWVKELLPEYSHKFVKYDLCDVMSKSYVFEAIIRKLSPEYESSDYNPKRNIFRSLLPLDNINKFNEIFEYIQNQMNITVVITAYDLHFGNLSSIFIIIKQLQRYENNHLSFY